MNIQTAFERLHRAGESWRQIGNRFGKTGGWAWLVAHSQIYLNYERIEEILASLPSEIFWNSPAELDNLVLDLLSNHDRLTGRELARLCGTIDRTIRNSIKRLREAGHKINGSMGLPRGYRLEG